MEEEEKIVGLEKETAESKLAEAGFETGNWEDEKIQKAKHLVLGVSIQKTKNGLVELHIRVAKVNDELTIRVFKKIDTEDEQDTYEIREVIEKDGEFHYENEDDDYVESYYEYFETYKEAREKAIQIIKEVKENREKVLRGIEQNEGFYVSF
jgi:hypothetical protein